MAEQQQDPNKKKQLPLNLYDPDLIIGVVLLLFIQVILMDVLLGP